MRALRLFKIRKMTKEEIQKQIEAVRGLVKGHNALLRQAKRKAATFCSKKEMEENTATLNSLSDSIQELTKVLTPYLDGQTFEQ